MLELEMNYSKKQRKKQIYITTPFHRGGCLKIDIKIIYIYYLDMSNKYYPSLSLLFFPHIYYFIKYHSSR